MWQVHLVHHTAPTCMAEARAGIAALAPSLAHPSSSTLHCPASITSSSLIPLHCCCRRCCGCCCLGHVQGHNHLAACDVIDLGLAR
jgi:hypothetical protein